MQQFSIKDIENLLGIKAHTLRIWEHRYTFLSPRRRQTSSHRVYDNEDLKRLLRIAFLYHTGWKVSKIAALSEADIKAAVEKTVINGDSYPHFILQLTAHALEFNEAAFAMLVEDMIDKVGFENTMTGVCFPFLQRIGMLWLTNHLIPAQEHFSSYLIQNKIIAETEKYNPSLQAPEVLLFAPRNEYHELPLVYINYLLRKRGWSVLYLGKNISLQLLKEFQSHNSIQYLFLHLLTNLLQTDADTYLAQLVELFPEKIIIASGSAVHGVQRNFTNVRLLKSDAAILEFINSKR